MGRDTMVEVWLGSGPKESPKDCQAPTPKKSRLLPFGVLPSSASDSLRLVFAEPILHVDMDSFFVEVERLRDPGLIGRPVVVGGPGNRGVVASASYEARSFGIRSAMPMVAAQKRCPALVVVPTDHSLYQESSIRVFEVFQSITPLVEGLSLDEAFLDVSGLYRHFPTPNVIGFEIRRRIRNELGLPASVGIAATKFVAKLA